MASILQVSPWKPRLHLSSPPYVLHDLSISFFLSWSSESHLVRSYGSITHLNLALASPSCPAQASWNLRGEEGADSRRTREVNTCFMAEVREKNLTHTPSPDQLPPHVTRIPETPFKFLANRTEQYFTPRHITDMIKCIPEHPVCTVSAP